MKRILIVSVTIAALTAACGDPAAESENRQYANVGIAVELEGGDASSAPFVLSSAIETGGAVAITSASVNVAELAFKAAPGVCAEGNDDAGTTQTDENRDAGEDRNPVGMASATTAEADDGDDASIVADCGGSGFVIVPGPFRIDLLTGEATPSLDSVTMPAGSYRWVDLRLAPAADESDGMDGVSVLASGTYASDVTSFPVRIAMLVQDPPIRIKPAEGITVASGDSSNLVIGISAKDWFAGVDMEIAGCADEANAPIVDGVLQITGQTGTSCDAVNGKLRQNFIGAGEQAKVQMEARQ